MSAINKTKELEQNMTVYGYIRSCNVAIPDVLIDLCLLFYLKLFDEWDSTMLSDERLKLDVEKGTVALVSDVMGGNYLDAFGSIILSKGDIQSWKFKCIDTGETKSKLPLRIAIGIADVEKLAACEIHGSFGAPTRKIGIVYYGTGKKFLSLYGVSSKKYGSKWYYGEELIMTLDLTGDKFGKISFKKDDEDFGVLYDKIDVNRQYRMGISMIRKCTIQLFEE